MKALFGGGREGAQLKTTTANALVASQALQIATTARKTKNYTTTTTMIMLAMAVNITKTKIKQEQSTTSAQLQQNT